MKREQSTETETFERMATIERRADHGVTSYQASLSSEYPVERWGYTEILEHSEDAVNMERARNGLVLLFNHNVDEPIGRVNNLSIRGADKKLVGDLVFSKTEAGKLRQAQVDEGTLTDISIRYSVDKSRDEETEAGRVTRTVTRWTPQEGSIVSVPADPTVGVGRNQQETKSEGKPMSKDNDTPAKPEEKRGGGDVVVEFESGRRAGLQEGARVERERVASINALFDAPGFKGFDALRSTLIENGSSVEQARDALLQMIGRDPEQAQPLTMTGEDTQQRTPHVQVGKEQGEKTREAMFKATEYRAGMFGGKKPGEAHQELRENPYGGMTLSEIARACLTENGADVRGLSGYDVVGYALNPHALPDNRRSSFVGQGTSNFAGVVENIAGKSMMQGFDEAPETWRDIVRVGQVSSFRQESRVDLSEFSDLDTVQENGEYKHGSMTDNREYITASKYGKLFAITREVIVNDDLNALTMIPQQMGRAANRKIGDLVYSVLTTPSTLRDGTAIFDATRSNIITSGAAPSIAQLDSMYKLMALQSGLNSTATAQNIQMTILIVPVALRNTALILAGSVNDPDQKSTESGGGGTRPNPFNGIQVVSDARLDASSSVIYYGSANPNTYDTIEVAFLNGNQAPTLESRNGWSVDGIEYKTRLEVGVAPLGYRALVRNAGA